MKYIPTSTCDIWAVVPGYPDYEINTQGLVRRLTAAQGTWIGREYRGSQNSLGYRYVGLRDSNGACRSLAIHRLVLLTFVGPPPEGHTDACHGDGNKANNDLSNLRWGTRTQNNADKKIHGTQSHGERRYWAKLTNALVQEARARWRARTAGQRQMAREYGVSLGTLQRAIKGESWQHVKD